MPALLLSGCCLRFFLYTLFIVWCALFSLAYALLLWSWCCFSERLFSLSKCLHCSLSVALLAFSFFVCCVLALRFFFYSSSSWYAFVPLRASIYYLRTVLMLLGLLFAFSFSIRVDVWYAIFLLHTLAHQYESTVSINIFCLSNRCWLR
jgi:hypothetical protein